MTTAAIRERLYDIIRDADDKKVEAIYTLLDGDKEPVTYEWSEDEAFVAELNDRVERYKKGIDKAYTADEVEANFDRWKKERAEQKS